MRRTPIVIAYCLSILTSHSALVGSEQRQPVCAPCRGVTARSQPIPFHLIQSNVFLPLCISGEQESHEGWFILDTGTEQTILDDSLALARFGASVRGEVSLVAPTGRKQVKQLSLACVRIGKQLFRDARAVTDSMTPFSRQYNHSLSGIVGMEILRKTAIVIDYQKRELWVDSGPPLLGLRNVADLALQFEKGLPLISCQLPGGGDVLLIVDNGHDGELVLYDDSPVSLMDGRIGRFGDTTGTVPVREGVIRSIECGKWSSGPIRTRILPTTGPNPFGGSPRPGLLGNRILSRYLVSLDGPHLRLKLYERK